MGHALGRRIEWASMWWNPFHAGIQDTDLLAKQCDFLMGLIELCFHSQPRIDAVSRPASGVGHGELGQADRVQDGPTSRGKARRKATELPEVTVWRASGGSQKVFVAGF